jgi:hypothetical protein
MASIHFEPTLNARDRLILCSAPLVAVSRPTTCPVDIAHHRLAPDFRGFSASVVIARFGQGGRLFLLSRPPPTAARPTYGEQAETA